MDSTMMLVVTAVMGLAGALALAYSPASKQVVKTDRAPLPIGPYSQAVKHDNLVFVSGQLGMNLETKKLGVTVQEQAAFSLTHMKTILEAAGSGMDCVLKTTIFLTDISDFPAVNEVYASFFTTEPPARSTVQVARLPLGALVEIEGVAYVK